MLSRILGRMRSLVLWDIDLTLVDLSGVGHDWYAQALLEVTGRTLERLPSCAGRTEQWITAEVLRSHGLEASTATIRRMWERLIAVAGAGRESLSTRGRALPGAGRALAAVADRPDVVQSLVTGNLPEIARHKLAAFELDTHLDFDIGGYGSLSALRDELVGHAIRRATSKHGLVPESIVVIGDSPHDVTAARRHDATALGVTTGGSGADELYEAGATAVLPDLSDTSMVLHAVDRGGRSAASEVARASSAGGEART